MGSMRGSMVLAMALMVMIGVGAATSFADAARFESYQLQALPDNANILIGPFYSDLAFFQSVGIRYVKSSGKGMEYLYASRDSSGSSLGGSVTGQGSSGSGRGQIKKDGIDYPLVSQLTDRNYLLVSKYMSIDVSFSLTYRYFPNASEDNRFDVEIIDPGFDAQMGSFSLSTSGDARMSEFNGRNTGSYSEKSSGFSANLSTDFELTPFVRARLYERPSYRVDYVDQRGYSDNLSGQRYPVFQNLLGMDLDWQMAPDKTLGYTASRTDTVPQDNNYDINQSVVYRQMLEYRQQLNPLTSAGARADYFWRDYLDARGSQVQHDYEVFMNSDVTEDTSINAMIGYSMGTLSGASADETNGTSDVVIGEVGIQTRLSETLSHGLSCSRSQRAGFIAGFEVTDAVRYNIQCVWPESWSLGFSTAYEAVTPIKAAVSDYTDWANQISASRPLTRDLVLTLASVYVMRMNATPVEGEVGYGDVYMSRDYDTWATTAGLIQTLGKRLKLYTYVEHLERISSEELLQGTRNTVGMTLGYYYDF